MGDDIKVIPDAMFQLCTSLRDVEISGNLKSIGDEAFSSTAIEKIELPQSVTEIGDEAFYNTKLKKVVLPEKLSKIGYKTFESCRFMTSIYIPSNVRSIETEAFKNDGKLTSIYYGGSESAWDAIDIEESGNELLKTLKSSGRIIYNSNPASVGLKI